MEKEVTKCPTMYAFGYQDIKTLPEDSIIESFIADDAKFGYYDIVKGKYPMPLNKKGKEIKSAMTKEYGEKKAKEVFYASENSGKIKNVTKGKKK